LVGGGLIRSMGGWSAVLASRRRGQREAADQRILGDGDFVKQVISGLDDLVKKKLDKIYEKEKKVDNLGFVDNVKTAVSHRGVIPKETRIKYCNMAIEDYSMRTTDYYYEFSKKNKRI